MIGEADFHQVAVTGGGTLPVPPRASIPPNIGLSFAQFKREVIGERTRIQ